jgi:hypothetical protein
VSVRGVLLYDYWPDKPKPILDVKLSELAPAHAKYGVDGGATKK